MLPIVLAEEDINLLFDATLANEGYSLQTDLKRQLVITPDGTQYPFEVDEFRKHCLLNGLDDIGLTLENADDIKAYEEKNQQTKPWVFASIADQQTDVEVS